MNNLRKKWPFILLFIGLLSISACASSATVGDSDSVREVQPRLGSKSKVSNLTDGLRASDIDLGLLSNLIGQWKIQDWQLRKDGQWQALEGAQWSFRPIQNGRALLDEWVSYAGDGKTATGHVNAMRVYDPLTKKWQTAWLASSEGRVKLFTGEQVEGEVIFTSSEPAKGRLARHVFSDISPQNFNWRIEWSKDGGESWLPVYRVEAKPL